MDGDTTANKWLEDIYAKYYSTVYKYILVSLNYDRELTGDCMQDIFTLLLEKADTVTIHPNPGGFLMITARNYIMKYKTLLAVNAKRTTPIDESTFKLYYEENFDSLFDSPLDMETMKIAVLNKLNTNEQALYRLFYENKRSVAEITDVLQISKSNVKIRLFRLRIKVRDIVKELLVEN